MGFFLFLDIIVNAQEKVLTRDNRGNLMDLMVYMHDVGEIRKATTKTKAKPDL